MRNYYCSQKFWWLSVDIEKRVKYSCCEADPVKINIDSLNTNSNELFNCNQLQQEREMMLANQRVATCETACWIPHDQGKLSRIDQLGSSQRTHTTILSNPEYLNVVFGSDCNMTCVYCCKNYSSAWRRDVLDQGDYAITGDTSDRFCATTQDRVINMVSRPEIQSMAAVDSVLTAIKNNSQHIATLVISGGEPFLSNSLGELINMVPAETNVKINTGLGVNTNRLQRQLEAFADRKNLYIEVSAENTEEHYEFSRYGNTWENFCNNFELLKDFDVGFRSTITNVTAINFDKFYQQFQNYPIEIQFCSDPEYLSVEVLDPATKALLADQLKTHSDIVNNLETESTEQQRIACRDYLFEFGQRRNISLNIFPKEFLSWLQQ